ncbi:MAG: hypothetical protein M1827_006035 [Pycnora praestabilis]|nr:MAG: hypothetical protein M1827_006035 [Pycnora praestabilis]
MAIMMATHAEGFQYLTLRNGIAASVVLPIVYFLGTVIYNLYFHPLRHYPGPKSWAATRIPYVTAIFKGRLPHRITDMHTQYGEVVRLGPDELSFINGTAWTDIYGFRRSGGNFAKDTTYFTMPPNDVHTIITANDADHTRIRRLLIHGFSEKALKDQEPLLQRYVGGLVQALKERSNTKDGGVVDILEWYKYSSFDITADMSFGEQLGCVQGASFHPWAEVLASVAKFSMIGAAFNMIPGGALFLKLIMTGALQKRVMEHWNSTLDMVHKRMAQETDQKDFMSYVMKYNNEKGMSKDEIDSTFAIIVLAGVGTTSTVMNCLTNYLTRTPWAMEKLVAELRGEFATEEDITLERLAALPYLGAVIEEGLRLATPNAGGLPRKVPNGGGTVNGMALPGGITVRVPNLAPARSPTNFVQPEDFIPDRWLPDSTYKPHSPGVYQSFSLGPRNCIGKGMAYAVLRLTLARMMWNFDFEAPKGKGTERDLLVWREQDCYMGWEQDPLEVRLKIAAH